GRALADGGGRFDFRRGFYLFASSAGFHPVHARALAAHQPRRFSHGLDGGQRFNRALVRAHARPRARDRRHGPWLGQSLHAGGGNVEWSRREALRTPVFWLIASTFGVAQIGVTGLNLHVFSYVTDQGHPTLVAASVMSIIAIMQFSTPIVWGTLADRMDNGILNMAKC